MSQDASESARLAPTARWTAAVRARESQRPDRLFNDPWAAVLAGEEGQALLDLASSHFNVDTTAPLIVRTRFFDDFLLRISNEQPVRQVVILAAGMDARGFRFSWPEQTRLFELDQPQVLALKEQILSSAGATPTCQRHAIGVNLNESWEPTLLGAGFDQRQPSLWLLEGLLNYLTEEAVALLFDRLTALAAPGSRLGFDVSNNDMLTSQWTRYWIEYMRQAGLAWLSGMDNPEEFMAARGWSATVAQPGEEEANYGRWPYPVPAPRSVPNHPRTFFVTAKRDTP